MERRHDPLLRAVVDSVLPRLRSRAFRLEDRGTFGEFHWVEFARQSRGDEPAQFSEQSLIVYHLAAHQHLGARLSQRALLGSTPGRRLASRVWPLQPNALKTDDGQDVTAAMDDWVAAAVDATYD